jgi:hypothetical protein
MRGSEEHTLQAHRGGDEWSSDGSTESAGAQEAACSAQCPGRSQPRRPPCASSAPGGPAAHPVTGGGSPPWSLTGSPSDDRCDAPSPARPRRGVGKSIALYGRDPERLRAEVLDLHHGLQFVPTATVIGSADLEVCRGADVVAVTASAPMVPGRSRSDLAEANVAICRELVPRLVEVAPSAIFLFVTNPVDVITYAALRISGLPRSQGRWLGPSTRPNG